MKKWSAQKKKKRKIKRRKKKERRNSGDRRERWGSQVSLSSTRKRTGPRSVRGERFPKRGGERRNEAFSDFATALSTLLCEIHTPLCGLRATIDPSRAWCRPALTLPRTRASSLRDVTPVRCGEAIALGASKRVWSRQCVCKTAVPCQTTVLPRGPFTSSTRHPSLFHVLSNLRLLSLLALLKSRSDKSNLADGRVLRDQKQGKMAVVCSCKTLPGTTHLRLLRLQ